MLAVKHAHLCLSIKVNVFLNDSPNQEILRVMWMKNRHYDREIWTCETIEKVTNLVILADPKPKKLPSLAHHGLRHFSKVYAPFKTNRNYTRNKLLRWLLNTQVFKLRAKLVIRHFENNFKIGVPYRLELKASFYHFLWVHLNWLLSSMGRAALFWISWISKTN